MKLLCVLLCGLGPVDDREWTALWARLQALEQAAAATQQPGSEAAWAAFGRDADALARAVRDDPDAGAAERFRVALVARVLALREGRDAPALDDAQVPDVFLPGEAFVAARHLAPGGARARAFAAALEGPLDNAAVFPVLNAAFAAFVEDEAAWRAASARTLAEAMHARAGETWSAFCLEGIARRQGDYAVAERVLGEQIASTPEGAERTELVLRLALAATGAGDRELARDLLGLGLLQGATDAYQMLGLEALSAGRGGRARRLFGVLVERDRLAGEERAPWALRGWGVSQLASPPTKAVRGL